MTDDNSQYLQVFLDETSENIQVLNTICLQLEQGGTDDNFATMFRAAHTLKGMSATMGFNQMAQVTHRLEDALGILRETPNLSTPEIIDAFFEAIDALEAMLAHIQDDGTEGETDYSQLIQRLNQVGSAAGAEAAASVDTLQPSSPPTMIELSPEVQNAITRATASGQIVGYLNVEFDQACIMKAPRAIMVVRAIDEYADAIACNPTSEQIEVGDFDSQISFLLVMRGSEDELAHSVKNISEITDVRWANYGASPSHAQDFSAKPQETSTERANPDEKKATTAAKTADRTIRVPVERLDLLMNLLSELVIDRTRLASVAAVAGIPDLKDITDKLSRVSNDLQASVMSLRMVPVDSLFQRFPRMIRDLSKSLKKDIRLEMSGMETEFDRTVIDEMGEALVHLIRNAADHGLESTEERVKAGKPKHGTVKLSAYGSGQHVFIEVQDDGGGIHTQKVRNRAIERGLITDEQADGMTEQQIQELLFASGFSTADTVSDISGRGVGLDAVKQKVQSLGGRIQIESVLGEGSTFRIQLPLTLSILQALMVTISGEKYAIPLGNIEEVLACKQSDLRTVQGDPLLLYRDKLVPVLDAGHSLNTESSLSSNDCNLVVCRSGTQSVAIAVHGLLGQQEIVNKSLGAYLRSADLFSGATILGNGDVALILDLNAWVNAVKTRPNAQLG